VRYLGALVAAALLALAGCSEDAAVAPATSAGAGGAGGSSGSASNGSGGEVGCPPGTIDDADCTAAGVPPDGCASGFTWLDGGCQAVLPTLPCPDGTMALPGDTSCVPIVDCGAAPYGSIATDANTQHVDAGYGGSSDGSSAQPWTSIQQGIDAAADGATVAIAAGSYSEALSLQGKAITLWGRCPELTHVDGGSSAAIVIASSATGSALRGLHLQSTSVAIQAVDVDALALNELWVRGGSSGGVVLTSNDGQALLTGTRIRVDTPFQAGITLFGAAAQLNEVMVANPIGAVGAFAFQVQQNTSQQPSSLTLTRGLITRFNDTALEIYGSSAELREVAISGSGAESSPRGIDALDINALPSNLALYDTVIEDMVDWTLRVRGSDAVLERVTLRNAENIGLYCLPPDMGSYPSSADIRQSLVEGVKRSGIIGGGCDLTVHATVVRDVTPRGDETTGHGVAITSVLTGLPVMHRPVTLRLSDSVVERAHVGGVTSVADVTGTVSRTLIRETQGIDDLYGDGFTLVAWGSEGPDLRRPDVRVERSLVRDNHRTGMAVFGSRAVLADTRILCNPIDLASQDASLFSLEPVVHTIENEGNNRCGCDGFEECRNQNVDIGPPPIPFSAP
jgi:hypothetical protein